MHSARSGDGLDALSEGVEARLAVVFLVAAVAVGAAVFAARATAPPGKPPRTLTLPDSRGLAADGTAAASVAISGDYPDQLEAGVLAFPLSRAVVRSGKLSARFSTWPPCSVA